MYAFPGAFALQCSRRMDDLWRLADGLAVGKLVSTWNDLSYWSRGRTVAQSLGIKYHKMTEVTEVIGFWGLSSCLFLHSMGTSHLCVRSSEGCWKSVPCPGVQDHIDIYRVHSMFAPAWSPCKSRAESCKVIKVEVFESSATELKWLRNLGVFIFDLHGILILGWELKMWRDPSPMHRLIVSVLENEV